LVEKELKDKLQRIFDLKRASYDQPSLSDAGVPVTEQQCLFIDVETPKFTVKDGRAVGRISGRGMVLAPNDKLTFGYFALKLKKAKYADTKDFYFFELDQNAKVIGNVVSRTFGFIYFFNSELDPNIGNIDSASITTSFS
jgi:hypothetical protein